MNRELRRALTARRVTADENLVEVEYYHEHEFDLAWHRWTEKDEYVVQWLGAVGPLMIIHPSKEFVRVPTKYYTPRAYTKGKAGDPAQEIKDVEITAIVNYGDSKGIRNTKASSPEAPKFNHRRIK